MIKGRPFQPFGPLSVGRTARGVQSFLKNPLVASISKDVPGGEGCSHHQAARW